MPSPVKSLSSDPVPSGSDSQAALDSIRQIVHALELGSRAAQKTVGLSGAQLFVLQTLAAATSLSVNELAIASCTHQSSVSVVVGRLVRAGFVRRTRSARDARRVELSVTPAGRRLAKVEFVTPQQRLLASLNRLPARRLADLRSLLHEVVSASGMELQKIPMFFEKNEAKSKKTHK